MKVILEDKLKDYMNEKDLKDIVVYPEVCNTWGGSYIEVLARFANKGEKLEEKGYKKVSSEMGDVYLPAGSLKYKDTITFGMSKFLWMPRVTVGGVSA